MFSIVENGSKQYKVTVGQTFNVEKLDAEVGSVVELKVLMTSENDKVEYGAPYLNKVARCEVVAQGKAPKIIVIRYKAKKNIRKRQGHRQPFTTLKLIEVK